MTANDGIGFCAHEGSRRQRWGPGGSTVFEAGLSGVVGPFMAGVGNLVSGGGARNGEVKVDCDGWQHVSLPPFCPGEDRIPCVNIRKNIYGPKN